MTERDRIQSYHHFDGRHEYASNAPEGIWTARLDHKAWGSSQNLILYVTDQATGAKCWLSVYSQDNYRPRDKGHDFRNDAEPGELFKFTTSKTKGGYLRSITRGQRIDDPLGEEGYRQQCRTDR